MHLKIAIISVLVLVYSCSMQPDWIENTTPNQDYWIGVGMINKPFRGDIREAAKNQAIKEIASQIEINISSEMTRVIEENNYNINDFTKSIIETRLENSFSHLEFSESYQNNESYYTLAKLSKRKYYDELRKKKENGINLAVELIEKSDDNFSINSILFLQQALNEIIKYIDEPIIIKYPKNSKNSRNLYSLIKTKIINSIENIEISPNIDKVSIRSGWIDTENKVIITSRNKQSGEILSNVPILIVGEDSEDFTQTITNAEGITEHVLSPNYNNSNYAYTIELKLNTKALDLPDTFSDLNKTQLIVNQIPLKIYIKTIEKNLGVPLEFDLAAPSIKEYLSKNIFVEFSPEKSADLVIQFSVNTSKKSDIPNEWDVYQTFGSGTLSVYDPKTNLELFSMVSDNIYGASFNSNIESGIDCIEEIIDKLINDNAKDMVEVLAGSKRK